MKKGKAKNFVAVDMARAENSSLKFPCSYLPKYDVGWVRRSVFEMQAGIEPKFTVWRRGLCCSVPCVPCFIGGGPVTSRWYPP